MIRVADRLVILNTTNAKAVRTVDATVHVGVAAAEAQVATARAMHRTGPIAAVAACVVDGTTVVAAVPCVNKLQR